MIRLLIPGLLSLLFFSTSLHAQGGQVVGFSFDIDNNILSLPTKIVVFKKGSSEFIELSTEQLAEYRENRKDPNSKWSQYYMSPAKGSFKYYRDGPNGENYFLQDIKEGIAKKGYQWRGPVWDAFVVAMASERTAREATFITARGHDPKNILVGLEYLRDQGFIKHVPKLENIWPVSHPDFAGIFKQRTGLDAPGGNAGEPSMRKAVIMEWILDKINRETLTKEAPLVLSPNGGRRGRYHTWGFSDDDPGNYRKAKKVLQKGVDKGRWGRTKIVLYYTGTKHASMKPHAIVLRKKQEPRPLTDAEENEWREILETRRAARSGSCSNMAAYRTMFSL